MRKIALLLLSPPPPLPPPQISPSEGRPEDEPSRGEGKVVVRIRVISGQHLPKSEERLKGDIIEPYVKVRLRGHPDDEGEYVTKVVPKVGRLVPVTYIVGVASQHVPTVVSPHMLVGIVSQHVVSHVCVSWYSFPTRSFPHVCISWYTVVSQHIVSRIPNHQGFGTISDPLRSLRDLHMNGNFFYLVINKISGTKNLGTLGFRNFVNEVNKI